MPVYEYQCRACQHEFEEWQKIKDDPIKTCPSCSKDEVERLISQTAFQLKGGGWYKDLYSSKASDKSSNGKSEAKSDAKGESKSGSTSDSKSESKSDSTPATKSESKSESKPTPKSSTGSSGGGGTTSK